MTRGNRESRGVMVMLMMKGKGRETQNEDWNSKGNKKIKKSWRMRGGESKKRR